jgi:hypothetical protein
MSGTVDYPCAFAPGGAAEMNAMMARDYSKSDFVKNNYYGCQRRSAGNCKKGESPDIVL